MDELPNNRDQVYDFMERGEIMLERLERLLLDIRPIRFDDWLLDSNTIVKLYIDHVPYNAWADQLRDAISISADDAPAPAAWVDPDGTQHDAPFLEDPDEMCRSCGAYWRCVC